MSENNGDNIRELRPGEKEKVREPRPPAEAPRTWIADDVTHVVDLLVQSGRPGMNALRGVRIVCIFSNADHEGDLDLAQALRFNPTYGYMYEDDAVPQFVLRVAKAQWDQIPDSLRASALYHYLLRFGLDEHGRPAIAKPDVVAFAAEIQEFPDTNRWNKGLALARQMGLFEKEPEPATAGRR